MFAVSVISTMNVDMPALMSSCAPTRVKMRSTRPMTAASAGTKLPHWASSTITAACRRNVDLPAMFGPVRMVICWPSGSSSRSLATKAPSARWRSTSGWRPPLMLRMRPALTVGRSQRSRAAATARLPSASMLPIACAVALRTGADSATLPPSSRRISTSLAEDDRFFFFELRRQVTLGASQRLLSDIVGRDGDRVGVADLDVVPEHLVESDLQRSDAGPQALGGFEGGDPLARALRRVGDPVELGVITAPDGAAVARVYGRVLDERTHQL